MGGRANKKGVFFGILLIIGGIAGAVFGVNYVAAANQSASWRTADGVTTAAAVSAHAGNGSSKGSYSVDVSYTYQVDGQSYQSDRLAFNGVRQYNSKSKAQAALASYAAGSAVTVYYHPDDPSVSVLESGSSWQAYRPLALAILVIILGGYLVRDQMAIREEK